jgi:hypothetical protein
MAHNPFFRNGQGENYDCYALGRWASYRTLCAAIRGTRLAVAEVEADGRELPLSIAITYQHYTKNGHWRDSEIVAIWKRGRFVWRDSKFVRRENAKVHRKPSRG